MESKSWTRDEFIEEFGSFGTLGEAITAVEKGIAKDGAVVCEVKINDMILAEEDEKRMQDAEFDEIEKFSIRISRPEDLVKEVKLSAVDYMDKLKVASIQSAEEFRNNNLEKAHRLFGAVVDAMTRVWHLMEDIRIVETGGDFQSEAAQEWLKLENEFQKLTQEILEAYQGNDLFLVSDLLEYELPGQLDVWSEKFRFAVA